MTDAEFLARLEAERRLPDPGERVAGHWARVDVAEALDALIGLLASLLRKGTT